MNKSYKIIDKSTHKKDIWYPSVLINYQQFISLVESCNWLIWDELRESSKAFFAEHPDLPKKLTAFYSIDENKSIEIGYVNFSLLVSFNQKALYEEIKLAAEFAKKLNCNMWDRDTLELVDDKYLEAYRIKEENRGIKLTKEQSHVLESIEDQCRWWYLPTDDVTEIFNILGIQPRIKDGDITTIIDDVQRENKVAIATFTGHTIIFGFNAPYISYPDLQTYITKEEQQTPHLQDVLNKLSKAFGTAAYFEYNNDDEQIASLAWSSKGKFVYGRFTSEGEGFDVFGTQKKTIEVNQKSIIKTAKKLGLTPEEIITGIMKQKIPVQYFEQPHWYIESRLSRRH
ncbi:MAG: hypothetical protein IPO37_18460 [Saprospiraceae bacterium]|nr:hypothetical protein [Saprospiraceae bacterium]